MLVSESSTLRVRVLAWINFPLMYADADRSQLVLRDVARSRVIAMTLSDIGLHDEILAKTLRESNASVLCKYYALQYSDRQ